MYGMQPSEVWSTDPRFLYGAQADGGREPLLASYPLPDQRDKTSASPPAPVPAQSFDLTGLDFAGLDMLHSFTPGGYMGNGFGGDNEGLDQLWQSWGSDTFRPEQQPFGTLNSGPLFEDTLREDT